VAWPEPLLLDRLGELEELLLELDDEELEEEEEDEEVEEVEDFDVEDVVFAEAAAAMPTVPKTLTAARPPVTSMTRRRPRSRPGS
jgi:hypothetical protein